MKCLSRMTGNCHVRFLGGKAVVTPLTQPIIEELAANFESLGEDRPEDGEHSETQKKTTAEADRKEPTAEEASVKRLYESVNWRSLAAQAAVVAVPAVAAAIYSHRRNIKLF